MAVSDATNSKETPKSDQLEADVPHRNRRGALNFLIFRYMILSEGGNPRAVMAGFHHHIYKSGMSSGSSGGGGSGGYDLSPMPNYYNSPVGSLNLGAGDDGGLQLIPAAAAAAQNSSLGPSPSSLLLDSVPGLKHDTGLAVEWSVEEQYKLEEGLAK